MKKFLVLLCLIILPAQAFEDCVISTDGKLSDISIEHNDIVDIYPIFTIMNEKNTLIVHPLKIGKTRVCVLKNNKEKVMFHIEVKEDSTIIDDVDEFDILSIDAPPYNNEMNDEFDFDLDTPPIIRRFNG